MRRIRPLMLATLLALAVVADVPAQSADKQYQLPIGDPARRDKDAPVVLDAITDTSTGDLVTPAELAARLKGVQLLLVGETHTSEEAHRVQLRVVEALVAAGRRVMIGLEMFPYTEQKSLDQWRDGLLTEEGFVRLARWYEHWGYHWSYYRDIFLFARDQRIPMVAVNTPREVVTAVRKKGFENLTPEEAALIPPSGVDVNSADHMTFFKSAFSENDMVHGGMSEEAWKGMLAAQATWDASMGWNAVQALKKAAGPQAIMVVLVGSGHVAYGVGIERQARRWFDGGIATLVPVPVSTSDSTRVEQVRASYANYVWGVLPESDSTYPTLGLSTRAGEGGQRVVIQITRNSPAADAGVALNDVLLAMDGQPLPDRETLNALMARKHWGDSATLTVKRGTEEKTLTAYFRRKLPSPKTPSSSAAAAPVKK